jgi:hypothetical protein
VAQQPVRVERIATEPSEPARRAFGRFLRRTRRRETMRAIGRVFARLGGRA